MENKNPLVSTIKKVLPSVVAISVSKNVKELEKENPVNRLIPFKNRKLKFHEGEADKNGMIKTGSGSGFIVDPSGIIVSNRHVANDSSSKYTIITNDNKKYDAVIIARDPISDIAILKIEDKKKFPALKLSNSSKLDLGETVIAIGNALGIFQNTVSAGIISGLSRAITAQIDTRSPLQEIHGLIQTDAAINPGNSGGPLVNIKGEVIGINIAVISGAENIGFALPINTVKKDLEDLKKYGRIRRPFLGIHYLTIDEGVKEKMKLPVQYGALVKSEKPYSPSVISQSPADASGIKDGDIILECNNRPITENETVGDILEKCDVGEALTIKVLRDNKQFIKKITLTERK